MTEHRIKAFRSDKIIRVVKHEEPVSLRCFECNPCHACTGPNPNIWWHSDACKRAS